MNYSLSIKVQALMLKPTDDNNAASSSLLLLQLRDSPLSPGDAVPHSCGLP